MSEKNIEQWEVQELVDEAVASGQMRPEMLNEYVYQFSQGGRIIQDLTASSYHQIALKLGISTISIEREDQKGGVLYTVSVELDGQIRYGVAYEPYETNRGFDRFCFQKALTKATRNAIKQLVSATERFDTIAKLKALPASVEAPPAASQQAKPVETEQSILQKKCFEIWNEGQQDGTLPDDFWERVRDRYGVKSRNMMTIKNWRDCLDFMSELRDDAMSDKATNIALSTPEDDEATTEDADVTDISDAMEVRDVESE